MIHELAASSFSQFGVLPGMLVVATMLVVAAMLAILFTVILTTLRRADLFPAGANITLAVCASLLAVVGILRTFGGAANGTVVQELYLLQTPSCSVSLDLQRSASILSGPDSRKLMWPWGQKMPSFPTTAPNRPASWSDGVLGRYTPRDGLWQSVRLGCLASRSGPRQSRARLGL